MTTQGFPLSTNQLSRSEQDLELRVVAGNLPQGLSGHMYFMAATGPADSANEKVFPGGDGVSVFNGDGMVYRVSFADGKATWRSRLVKTPCFYADRATAPGTLYSNLGFSNHGLARLSMTLGFRNQLNTAIIPVKFTGDEAWRLILTWDANRPYEINTDTLELITPVGSISEWYAPKYPLGLNDNVFPMLPSGAHPSYDPHTQELYLVNWAISFVVLFGSLIVYNLTNFLPWGVRQLVAWLIKLILTPIRLLLNKILPPDYTGFADLMRWDGKNKLLKWRVVDEKGKPIVIRQSLHQISVTKDYVILMDTAFKFGLEQLVSYPSKRNMQLDQRLRDVIDEPQLDHTPIYIVRRSDLTPDRNTVSSVSVSIPRESAHFLANYSNPDGKVTIHLAHNNAWDPSEWLRDWDTSLTSSPVPHDLSGLVVGTTDLNSVGRYVIDVETAKVIESKYVADENVTWSVSIYAYDGMLSAPDTIDRVFWNCWGCWADLTTNYLLDMYRYYPYRNKSIEAVKEIAAKGIQNNICAVNTQTTEGLEIEEFYSFPPGYFASTPQFIPSDDGGFITATVNFGDGKKNKQSEIWIFRANQLKQGPVCKLSHPDINLGVTIHSTWIPEIGERISTYNVPVRSDYEAKVSKSSNEIKQLFEQEIYPHFI